MQRNVQRKWVTSGLKRAEAGTGTVIGFFIAQVLLVFVEQKGSESTPDVARAGEVVWTFECYGQRARTAVVRP
jgi:hypothetical protein